MNRHSQTPLGGLGHKMSNDTKGRLCAQAHNPPILNQEKNIGLDRSSASIWISGGGTRQADSMKRDAEVPAPRHGWPTHDRRQGLDSIARTSPIWKQEEGIKGHSLHALCFGSVSPPQSLTQRFFHPQFSRSTCYPRLLQWSLPPAPPVRPLQP